LISAETLKSIVVLRDDNNSNYDNNINYDDNNIINHVDNKIEKTSRFGSSMLNMNIIDVCFNTALVSINNPNNINSIVNNISNINTNEKFKKIKNIKNEEKNSIATNNNNKDASDNSTYTCGITLTTTPVNPTSDTPRVGRLIFWNPIFEIFYDNTNDNNNLTIENKNNGNNSNNNENVDHVCIDNNNDKMNSNNENNTNLTEKDNNDTNNTDNNSDYIGNNNNNNNNNIIVVGNTSAPSSSSSHSKEDSTSLPSSTSLPLSEERSPKERSFSSTLYLTTSKLSTDKGQVYSVSDIQDLPFEFNSRSSSNSRLVMFNTFHNHPIHQHIICTGT
jgi:hypothetical protein